MSCTEHCKSITMLEIYHEQCPIYTIIINKKKVKLSNSCRIFQDF